MAMDVQPVTPSLERLFRAVVEIAAPLSVGVTPRGERRIIPITGGRFEGPKLTGDVLPGGADWQLVRPDGTALLEARYTLRTRDGALVYVRNRGVRTGPPDVLARLARGDTVDRRATTSGHGRSSRRGRPSMRGSTMCLRCAPPCARQTPSLWTSTSCASRPSLPT